MGYHDHMIERFESPLGILGYDRDAQLLASHYPNVIEGFCPVWDGVCAIQNPARFATLYQRLRSGDTSVVGRNDGRNDIGLELTATGVHAEINLGMDTYEQELTFAEFDPILAVWERAWAAAQAYRRTLA